MKTITGKLASLLAFVIGAMAVFAGGKVLLGADPGYYVIDWLLLYNYTLGVLTISVTAILIWRDAKLAVPAAVGTLALHAAVMVILASGFREVVAADSIKAMTIRLIAWGVILALMFLQWRVKRKQQVGELREKRAGR